MGKASRKKKTGKKYYFTDNRSHSSNTLRTIYAESDEEAYNKIKELLGHENFTAGQLPHAKSKEEIKEDKKIAERVAGKLFGPVGAAAVRIMNS